MEVRQIFIHKSLYGTPYKFYSVVLARSEWLDFAKGLGILLVIIGHAPFLPVLLKNAIFEFHMPFFFFLSGYLFNSSKYRHIPTSLITLKFERLVIPYIVTLALLYLYWSLVKVTISLFGMSYSNDILDQPLGQIIISCLYGNGVVVDNAMGTVALLGDIPLWYLVCLFCSLGILYLLALVHEDKGILWSGSICLIIVLSGYLISRWFFLPWGVDIACVSMAFMFSGYLFRKNGFFSFRRRNMWLIFFFMIFIIVLIANGRVDMNSRQYNNIILFILGGLAGSLILVRISYELQNFRRLYMYVVPLGINSLVILCYHAVLPGIVLSPLKFISPDFYSCLLGNGLSWIVLSLTFSLISCYVFRRISFFSKIYG